MSLEDLQFDIRRHYAVSILHTRRSLLTVSVPDSDFSSAGKGGDGAEKRGSASYYSGDEPQKPVQSHTNSNDENGSVTQNIRANDE